MYKKRFVRKIGLPSDQRKALIKTLVRDLIDRSYVKTTLGRSYLVCRQVDVLGDYILKGNLKKAFDYIRNDKLLNKFSKIVLESGKISGFVKRRKISNRKGDNSKMVLLELLSFNNLKAENNKDLVKVN